MHNVAQALYSGSSCQVSNFTQFSRAGNNLRVAEALSEEVLASNQIRRNKNRNSLVIDRKRERGGSSRLFTPHQSTTCLLFLARYLVDSTPTRILCFSFLCVWSFSLCVPSSSSGHRSFRSSGPSSSMTRKRYRERRETETRGQFHRYLLSRAN